MKTHAILAALALCTAVPAAAIDILNGHAAARPHPDVATVHPIPFQAVWSELPEPEVVAMMLLGLVLIGYRASNEKFTP